MKRVLTVMAVCSVMMAGAPVFAEQAGLTSTQKAVEKQAGEAKRQSEKAAREAKRQADKQARVTQHQAKKADRHLKKSLGH